MATNIKGPCLIEVGGGVIELTSSLVTLGRALDNQVVLNSSRVSRYHAQIIEEGGRYRLRDLGSKNGTWINRQMLEGERPLAEGDLITLGNLNFTFRTGADMDETISDYSPMPTSGPALQIDLEAMEVRLGGKVLDPPLSNLEWRLLALLYEYKNRVCPRDQIIEIVYQPSDPQSIPYDSALETLVSRLRKHLGLNDPAQLPRLKTIRGVGYKLEI